MSLKNGYQRWADLFTEKGDGTRHIPFPIVDFQVPDRGETYDLVRELYEIINARQNTVQVVIIVMALNKKSEVFGSLSIF